MVNLIDRQATTYKMSQVGDEGIASQIELSLIF